jgi:hypothetical protein
LGEGIREDNHEGKIIRQSNKLLVKIAANRKETGGRKQVMSRINQELGRPGMRDVWENGRKNNKKVCIKMCRHRKTKYGSYKERDNSLRSKWEEEYIEL